MSHKTMVVHPLYVDGSLHPIGWHPLEGGREGVGGGGEPRSVERPKILPGKQYVNFYYVR